MNGMKRSGGVLAALLLFASAATAAMPGHAGLDGVWKLASPQVALAPAGGGDIPFTKEGRETYEQNRKYAAARDYGFDQTSSTCSAPGLPRLMIAPGRLRILARPTVVTMMFEWNRQYRQIEMRPVAQKQPEVDSMNGVSYGRWEGDTLVVKSFGFFPDKLLDNFVSGSDMLQLLERIRLKDRNTLEDRITITDQATFSRPWDVVLTYKRQPDEALPEDNCLDRKKAGQVAIAR